MGGCCLPLSSSNNFTGLYTGSARGWQLAFIELQSEMQKSQSAKWCAQRTGYLSLTWTFVSSFWHHIGASAAAAAAAAAVAAVAPRVSSAAVLRAAPQSTIPQRVSAFANRSEQLRGESPRHYETSRAVTLQSKCRRRSCTRVYAAYAWTAAGSGVPSHGYFLAAKCANFGGQPELKSRVFCRQSQRVPGATQRRNMECWPACRCVKVAETIKHLTSQNAFQNKSMHSLLPVNSWTKIKHVECTHKYSINKYMYKSVVVGTALHNRWILGLIFITD